jgi:hypothetical protein
MADESKPEAKSGGAAVPASGKPKKVKEAAVVVDIAKMPVPDYVAHRLSSFVFLALPSRRLTLLVCGCRDLG